MQMTEFYINGYRVDRGPILSAPITIEMALKAIELQKANEGKDIIAKLQVGGFIYNMLINNITTNPIEDLSDVTEIGHVLEIFLGDRNSDISDWKSLVAEEKKRQERLNNLQNTWDKIEIEQDPIKYIRSYFGSHDLTATHGHFISGKPFISYDLSMAGNFRLGYKGTNVDVEFGLDRKLDKYIDKLYDVLESWSVHEDFMFNLTKENTDLELKEGAKLIATYGITDNVIRGKVEDFEYGVTHGFEHRSYIKYGIKIELDICNRYLNNIRLERIIENLAKTLDITIPPLVEVLK